MTAAKAATAVAAAAGTFAVPWADWHSTKEPVRTSGGHASCFLGRPFLAAKVQHKSNWAFFVPPDVSVAVGMGSAGHSHQLVGGQLKVDIGWLKGELPEDVQGVPAGTHVVQSAVLSYESGTERVRVMAGTDLLEIVLRCQGAGKAVRAVRLLHRPNQPSILIFASW